MSPSTVLFIARTIFISTRSVVFVLLIAANLCEWSFAAATDQLTRLKEGIGNSESNVRTVVYPQSRTTTGNPLAAERVGGTRLEAIRNEVAPVIRRVSGTLPASSTAATTDSTTVQTAGFSPPSPSPDTSPSEPPRQNPLRISSSYPSESSSPSPPRLVSQVSADSTSTQNPHHTTSPPTDTIGNIDVMEIVETTATQESQTGFSEEEKAKLAEKYAQLPSLLEPPSQTAANTDTRKEKKNEFAGDLKKFMPVAGSLCLVLGCFFVFVLIARKATPKNLRGLPKEAFEVLGRTTLTPKIQLHLLRLGHHLALVSVTADGIQTVAEVTDPDEVTFVLGILKQNDPNSSTTAFNRMLSQYSKEPTAGGYFGTGTGIGIGTGTGTGTGVGTKPMSQRIPATGPSIPPPSSVPVGESLANFLASGGVRR